MKQTRNFRRILSFLLIVTMLVSVAVVGIAGVSAAEGLGLNYSYKYTNAGYAEGRIELTGSTADYGTYYLYWANDTKALDGYAEIAAVNLNSSRKSISMEEFTAIPADATKIIAIKSATAPATKTVEAAAVVYSIPEAKRFGYSASDVEYNFQTLSDIHFHKTGYYTYAEPHFMSALNAAAARDAEFISTCGDQTNYGENSEWVSYLSTIANSNFTGPVYEVTGNHEDYGTSSIPSSEHTMSMNRFMTATGVDVTTDKMRSELYYEVTAPNGDHHIYLSLELVNNGAHPGISDNFSKAQMDWLEGLLNKYKNDGKKVFIYEHAPFQGYGAGDNKETPYYGAAMTIDKNLYPQTYRFKELLEANKNIVWFSGHTHIDFKYNYNIDNENGTTAYTVHVPSTASTTTVNAENNGLVYEQKADSAQGYFVDVYADATVINGTDLVKNLILPRYTYLVDYTGNDATADPDYKDLEDLYEKVNVTVDVKAVVENPASVRVSLYGADDEGATSAVTMTKNDDGTYTAAVSTMYTKMKFVINNGTNDINSAEYTVAETTIALSALKIKYNNENNWSNVNIYAWSNVGGEVTTWPGMAMTKEADGTYIAIIPDYPDMVIFNDGTNQTEDLSIAPYIAGTQQPTQPTTTEPPVVITYLYGDADLNGIVNIKDATTVQKYAADMLTLSEVAFIQANVTGDKAVNVRDCTAIQKKIAGLITSFAVEAKADAAEISVVAASDDEGNTPAPVVPANVAEDIAAAKTALANEKYYASYVAYAALKKAYFACKDKDVTAVTAQEAEALATALANYKEMKKNNPSYIGGTYSEGGSTGGSGITKAVTVYFEKPADWDAAYIHLMNADLSVFENPYPGYEMTLVEGNKYSFTVPAGVGAIKFKNSWKDDTSSVPNLRTENVTLADIADGRVYKLGASTGTNKWSVTWEGGSSDVVIGEDVTVYFEKPADWDAAYIHLMNADLSVFEKEYPGYEMTLVEGNKYSFVVPAAVGAIKFKNSWKDAESTVSNLRTENILRADIADGRVYKLGESAGTGKWYPTWEGGTTPTPGGSVTVYFVNSSNWSTVNAYVWSSSPLAEWPGKAMTKTGDKVNGYDVYSYTFDAKYGNIIFNNGSTQTDDLTVKAGQYFNFKDKTWYATANDVPAVAPPSTEAVTIYFNKPADWADAYIYLMDSDQAATGTAYPGDKMTLVEGSKYSFEVPAGTGYIKFTDGTGTDPNMRTENASVVGGKTYEVDFDKPTSGKTNSWATK